MLHGHAEHRARAARRDGHRAASASDPFEILMVRRNDKVAFMAGSYVFPGGRVDDGDRPPPGARLPAGGVPRS